MPLPYSDAHRMEAAVTTLARHHKIRRFRELLRYPRLYLVALNASIAWHTSQTLYFARLEPPSSARSWHTNITSREQFDSILTNLLPKKFQQR